MGTEILSNEAVTSEDEKILFNDNKDKLIKSSERYAYFKENDVLIYKILYFITDEIVFSGYKDFPPYFYKSGGGLTNKFNSVAINNGIKNYLGDDFKGKIILEIAKNKDTHIKKTKTKIQIILNAQDWNKLLNLGMIAQFQGKSNANNSISEFLHNVAPEYSCYHITEGDEKILKKMFLSSLNKNMAKNFSTDELRQIEIFYNEVLDKNQVKTEFINKNIIKIREVSINRVINEFQLNLQKSTTETIWQRFFEKNIFIFDSRYIDFIPKFNLKSGRTSEPDFIVYDIYGFADIYEIKKADKKVLRFDKDHDNYYWSDEVAKSIAQLEKYIFQASENRFSIEASLKEKKGQDIKIIRPRGVLVIGSRNEFTNPQMESDFSILRSSHKNIEIILYDELLSSLKNLQNSEVISDA